MHRTNRLLNEIAERVVTLLIERNKPVELVDGDNIFSLKGLNSSQKQKVIKLAKKHKLKINKNSTIEIDFNIIKDEASKRELMSLLNVGKITNARKNKS